MKNELFGLAVAVVIAVSLASLAWGFVSESGCCSCSCPPVGGSPGFETCTDLAGSNSTVCEALCDTQNCTFSFFVNDTACTDPALAETCGDSAATMAPAASSSALALLAALLSGVGVFYLRRR